MRGLLILLVVFGCLLVVADRVAVAVAQDRVADRIAEQGGLPGPPVVDITGFPFLTQALSGRYDDVRISLSAAQLGQPEGTTEHRDGAEHDDRGRDELVQLGGGGHAPDRGLCGGVTSSAHEPRSSWPMVRPARRTFG